jgi:hypothetical protein
MSSVDQVELLVPPYLTCRLGFLALARSFLCWVGFFVKNYSSYPARELLRVKSYDSYRPIALIGSDWVGFFRVSRVRLVRSEDHNRV